VNRTYVKYVHIGQFPSARRAFQVTRCNQCDHGQCLGVVPQSAPARLPRARRRVEGRRIRLRPDGRVPGVLFSDHSRVSLRSEWRRRVRILREPKRLQLYEGGHIAPQEILIPAIAKWLDETMGPVEQ